MKEVTYSCDICGTHWKVKEMVQNEMTITTSEEFIQYIEVCKVCIASIVGSIKRLQKANETRN